MIKFSMFKNLYQNYISYFRYFLIFVFEILFPFLIIDNLVNKKELKIFQSIDYPSIILLILLWIFFSYLKERYSRFSSQIINEIYLLNLRKIFTICILVTSFLFILKAMGINLYLNTKNLPLLLLILTTLSLSQEIFVINIFLFLFPQKYKNIFILGSENDLHQIRDILKNYKYERKLKFKIINYDYDYESNLIPDQLIITKENKMIQNESKLLKNFIFCGVQITSKYKWFENELKCIPVELIVKENFLNSEILFNDKNFQFKLKRIFDIILSFLLLIITFPIILFSGLLIWISDRGPILYRQEREGLFKKKFNIYKLRSMIVNAESSGPQWASKNDKRITLVGNILRRTRIDELPQLISVLKGDMSLIGPRPERPEFNKLLEKEIPFYNLRHLLKPGLSGWAQVNYTYSSTLSESKNKLSYDLFYISNFSIFLDFLILFKTMRIVFSGKGL